MKVTFVAGVVLAGASLGTIAFASARPTPFPQNIGEREAYRFSATTQTPHGPLQQGGTLIVSVDQDGTYIIVDGADDGAATDSDGRLQRDGTVAISHLKSERPTVPFALQRLNEIAQIAAGYHDGAKSGDKWRTSVDLPLPGGQTGTVPAIVTVTAVSGDEVDLSANGQGTAPLALDEGITVTGGGPAMGDGITYNQLGPQDSSNTIPVQLSLTANATFVAGKLQAAKGTLHATVEAMHRDITSDWTLTNGP